MIRQHTKFQRGQMTIFIALIFQVLFVFFAMIINVGMIVHDKINLQNSVDLAAYYGAQRQAEILNAIAHQNYQIRQANKLLAWRIRVLGDLGNKEHPFQKQAGYPSDTSIFSQQGRIPSVCINHDFWGTQQNVCGDARINIPAIPEVKVIAGFLPWNILTNRIVANLAQNALADCNATTPMNEQIASKWLLGYRAQVARAKETIRTYASNLSQSQENFLDIRGDSTAMGVLKTLSNNLTRANNESLEKDNFHFFNSLGGADYKKWLNEVLIYPAIFYTKLQQQGGPCTGVPILATSSEGRHPDLFREPEASSLYHSSFGFEKNPWMMAYVGVYAETKPHKPYLPFGKEIVLRARAYAKPFGGRIGPWYFSKWQSGSNKSTGTSNDKVDLLAPAPLDEDTSSLSPAQIQESIPNYSRYPGDTLGLESAAALALFRDKMKSLKPLLATAYSGVPQGDDGLAFPDPRNPGSPMSQLSLGYRGPWIRDFEAAAVAPDLFDITYYSIDLDAYRDYTMWGIGKIFPQDKIPYDFGSVPQKIINVQKQIEIANQLKNPFSSGSYYLVTSPEHLLTAWAPAGAYQYSFPDVFGQCAKFVEDPNLPAVPGRCAQGGRVGYSVKIVSKEYLTSQELMLGGEGIKGSILNPPPF